jgi:rhodanese-related sulfurtransferase
MTGRDDVVIVDVRDIRELQRDGKIPGSFHAPRGMLEFWVDPESPYFKPVFGEDKTFIIHCASGWRSLLATQILQRMGLKPVLNLKGGFGAWKEAGGAIEQVEKS